MDKEYLCLRHIKLDYESIENVKIFNRLIQSLLRIRQIIAVVKTFKYGKNPQV